MSAPSSGEPRAPWSTNQIFLATPPIGRDPTRRANLPRRPEPKRKGDTVKGVVPPRFPVQLPRDPLLTPSLSSQPPGAWTHRLGVDPRTRAPAKSWAALSKSSGSWSLSPRSTGIAVTGTAAQYPAADAAALAGATTWRGLTRKNGPERSVAASGEAASMPTGKNRHAVLPPRLARLASTSSGPPRSATGTEGDWFQVLRLKKRL